MLHPPGSRLGPYEIVSAVGAGGMGDVYKARDTRLGRTVAIKVAKEQFGERFRNEALAVAALNHPHICALFDVGPDYLVMEFVEGRALRGPIPPGGALLLAGEIADALEHAHRHGIVHRDLKPSNILVTKAGVKVLDFGLAKRLAPLPTGEDSQPTLTDERTLLGTPRYMAPEQIDGKPADERTDVFAFGLVLYEMLTGARAFEGKSAAGVMAAILEREPTPISALKPTTPPALEQVVMTCLAKDPAERWQSVRELKHALGWAARPGPVARGAGRAWVAAIGSAVLAAALTFAVAHQRDVAEKPVPVRFQISLPEKAKSDDLDIAVSPDGRRVVLKVGFDEVFQLYVRPLDSLDLTPVPGSETAFQPFWSPDGRQIGFASPLSHALKKVDLAGGPAQTLSRIPGFEAGANFSREGATWSREDVIVFSAGGRLFRMPARGGDAEPLGKLVAGESGRYWPEFLPDARHYLYLSITARPEEQGIYVGSLDSDFRKRIVASEYQAAYSPPGQLLFVKDDALMAQPFDATSLELSGEPVPVLEQLAAFKIGQPAPHAIYSVSANGVLAWRPRSTPLLETKELTWFDRSGEKLATLGEPAVYFAPALSPDERSVAVCRMDPVPSPINQRDIYIFDVARGTPRRLTFDPADDCGPAWSPDGRRIAFFSDRRGTRELYEKASNGSGDDDLLLASNDQEGHDPLGPSTEDWSADGRFLVYNALVGTHFNDLFLLPMSSAGRRKPIPFLTTTAAEYMGTIAPNGRWIAYRSDYGGRGEIYVSDLSPRGERGPGKWQVSTGGGWQPRWRRDGKELFYSAGSTLMAVAVKPDAASFEAATPRPLFDVPLTGAGLRDRFAVTRDGQRFLLNIPQKSAEPVRVLVNWLPPGR
jgi:eukaryotic-like serine/threonine-protein kinase